MLFRERPYSSCGFAAYANERELRGRAAIIDSMPPEKWNFSANRWAKPKTYSQMKIARHWKRAAMQIQMPDGKPIDVTAWGWSADTADEAQKKG